MKCFLPPLLLLAWPLSGADEPWTGLIEAGTQSLSLGRNQEALNHFLAAQNSYRGNRSSPSNQNAEQGIIHHLIASAYFEMAKPAEALDYESRALKLFRAAGDQYLSQQLVCLNLLGQAQERIGNERCARLPGDPHDLVALARTH